MSPGAQIFHGLATVALIGFVWLVAGAACAALISSVLRLSSRRLPPPPRQPLPARVRRRLRNARLDRKARKALPALAAAWTESERRELLADHLGDDGE